MITAKFSDLSDAELAFIARTVALRDPAAAARALDALAVYKREFPGPARFVFGAERAAAI